MKRTLPMVLLGTLLLVPTGLDAQRTRGADRVVNRRTAPVGTGRLAACRPARDAQPYTYEPVVRHRAPVSRDVYAGPAYRGSRVVYRYAGPPRHRVRRAWVAPSWGRIHIRVDRRYAFAGRVDNHELRYMLGTRTVARVHEHGRYFGLDGRVMGHWLPRGQGRVLVLTMDGQEVARVADLNRDGVVDEVLLRNFRDRYRAW